VNHLKELRNLTALTIEEVRLEVFISNFPRGYLFSRKLTGKIGYVE
jgi:hypothetical protein